MQFNRDELDQMTSKIRDEIPSLHLYALDLIDDSVAKSERIMRWEEIPWLRSNDQKDDEPILDMLRNFTLDEEGQVEITDELYMRWMLTVIVNIFMRLYDPSIRRIGGITISNQAVTELSLVKYRSDKLSALVDLWKKIAMDMIKMKLTAKLVTKIDF